MASSDRAATLAEQMGLTSDLAGAMCDLARRELEAGRAAPARAIAEGLVVANPHDAEAWALLARAHRAMGQRVAARFCGEVAARVGPGSSEAALARAEALLAFPEERGRARKLLRALAEGGGPDGDRAAALLRALGEGGAPGRRADGSSGANPV